MVISLPNNSKFGGISDRDIERIFKYLVSLVRYHIHIVMSCSCGLPVTPYPCIMFELFSPQLHRQGFTFVLDRRKDKWNTVKNTLQKIEVQSIEYYCIYVMRRYIFLFKLLIHISDTHFK